MMNIVALLASFVVVIATIGLARTDAAERTEKNGAAAAAPKSLFWLVPQA